MRKGGTMADLILVVDSDPWVRGQYRALLEVIGCRMIACDHADLVLNLVEVVRPDVVIVDMHPNGRRGTDVVCDLKSTFPDLHVVLCAECTCFEDDFASWAADARVARRRHGSDREGSAKMAGAL
ncbi:MAG: response regulator [Planctomycetota bacterium]